MFSLSFLLSGKVVTVVTDSEGTLLLKNFLSDRAVQINHVGTGKELKFTEEGKVVEV